jgi:hypothetical protein
MNDDIRRIQDDIQRQRQELEKSASLLKNTQPRVFSGTDGTFKSPNKRFAFARTDSALLLPFSIISRSNGIGVTAGTINAIMPINLYSFGTKKKNCTIIARCLAQKGIITSAVLEEGPATGKPQEYEEGFPPENIYVTLVSIDGNGDAYRAVNGSVGAFVVMIRGSLTYPPVYIYSWSYLSGGKDYLYA